MTTVPTPPIKGPKKGKENRHTFAPELEYAPPAVAVPVGCVIVLALVFFVIHICKLKIPFNNVPSSTFGKLYVVFFLVSRTFYL